MTMNYGYVLQSATYRQEVAIEYYAETGMAKAKAVADYICSEYFNEECQRRKLLIFAHHQAVMDTICTELAKKVKILMVCSCRNVTDVRLRVFHMYRDCCFEAYRMATICMQA